MKIRFVQEFIDILRGKVLYLPGMIRTYCAYKHVKDYQTLALGSSHMGSYIPDDSGINMSMASQDLYYSYKLYNLLYSENPKIKNIILSFSVFTPGHCLIKTNEKKLAVLYKVMYGIDYQFPEIAKKKHLPWFEKHFKSKVDEFYEKTEKNPDYRGGMPKDYFDTTNINPEKAKKIALKHYKGNQRESSQMEYFEKFMGAIQENNQNLLIVISPMPAEYRNTLPEKEILFEKLYSACSKHPKVKILNLYDDNGFEHEEFYDEHHLNIKGAKKISRIINDILEKEFCLKV